LLHFWIPIAPDILQSPAQDSVEGKFVLQTLRSIRKRLEHFQPLAEMTDGLSMCCALAGSLTGSLPVGNSLGAETCFRVVMPQQFGLGLGSLGKLLY
jgi:hypothetical protein